MSNETTVPFGDETTDESARFAKAIQGFRDAGELLERSADLCEGDLSEAMADMPKLSADVFAQLFMSCTGECGRLGFDDKVFWLRVAYWMGPDWIQEFRRVGAFMEKAYEF